jgi:Bardet-Biedl syndrome 7 protein
MFSVGQIFFSHGQTIRGISKKAVQFFELISSVTETFQTIATEDTRIWAGCENIYNLYEGGVEAHFFIARDRINHLIVAHVTRDSDFDTVLACQDSCIRIIHGSNLFLEIPTDSPVTSLAFMEIESDASSMKAPTALVYGLATGALCLVQVFSNGEYTQIWKIEDGQQRSPVTSICVYDIDKDKSLEIIVGRDDGRIEVYKQQPESLFAVPYKVFHKDIAESVRSIECGVVSTPEYPEILVASYSGKIISFTTEPVHTRAQEDSYGRSILTISNENRIKHMKKEIEEMKKKIKKDKEQLAKTTSKSHSADQQLKPAPEFPINSKFSLDTRVAAYVLTVELQSPIDLIILRSPVVLDLVETDTGSSVLSVTPPQLLQQCAGGPLTSGEDLGKFVAVFRCQSQEKRIVLTLRTNEGEFGNLNITVVADTTPKAAKIVRYDLKPLSLHTKVYALTPEEAARPRNVMKYTGKARC